MPKLILPRCSTLVARSRRVLALLRVGALLIIGSGGLLAGETVIDVVPLSNRPATEILPLIRPLLDETDVVSADGFSLIVKTEPERLDEIKALIGKLDSRQSNLIITVLQSRRARAEALNAAIHAGVSVRLDDLSQSQGFIEGRYGQAQGGQADDSTQTVRTLAGNPAYIRLGQAYPLQSLRRYPSGAIVGTTEFVAATTGFAVTPRLAGQQVILDVAPWSDRMGEQGVIETQGAQTTVTANLGEWIELGGIDEDRNDTRQGYAGQSQRAEQNRLRILIKVDKTD